MAFDFEHALSPFPKQPYPRPSSHTPAPSDAIPHPSTWNPIIPSFTMYSRQYTRQTITCRIKPLSITPLPKQTPKHKAAFTLKTPFTITHTTTSLQFRTYSMISSRYWQSVLPYSHATVTNTNKANFVFCRFNNTSHPHNTLSSSRSFATLPPPLPPPPPQPIPSNRFTPEEERLHREIESWGEGFKLSDLRKEYFDFSFVRSSGPGGQNVNKVSSKAQLRFGLDGAGWIHSAVKKRIRVEHERYVSVDLVTKKSEFLIQSDVHRTQEQNIDECVKKLYDVIKSCCAVPKETSEVQKDKVRKMIEVQKKKDIEHKKRLKEKKADRRGGGRD